MRRNYRTLGNLTKKNFFSSVFDINKIHNMTGRLFVSFRWTSQNATYFTSMLLKNTSCYWKLTGTKMIVTQNTFLGMEGLSSSSPSPNTHTHTFSLSLNCVCDVNVDDACFNLYFATCEYHDPVKSHNLPL